MPLTGKIQPDAQRAPKAPKWKGQRLVRRSIMLALYASLLRFSHRRRVREAPIPPVVDHLREESPTRRLLILGIVLAIGACTLTYLGYRLSRTVGTPTFPIPCLGHIDGR